MPVFLFIYVLGVAMTFDLNAKQSLFKSKDYNLVSQVLADNLENPWAIEFLPSGSALVTERPGRLNLILKNGEKKIVRGLPNIWVSGQGGLLDVAVDPNFLRNKTIYFTFSKPSKNGRLVGTALARANLREVKEPFLTNLKIIFFQNILTSSSRHFGSRIVISPRNKIFITIGERGEKDRAQDPFDHAGSVIRINKDGTVPISNPFLKNKNALPEIWSIGHRNPQGAAWNYKSSSLWTVSHGAKGGDEINQPQPGKNYGWPIISYGRHYGGQKIGVGISAQGMEQPIHYWDPSVAPSGIIFYRGNTFPKWRGNLFVAALKSKMLIRLELKNNRIIKEERLFKSAFGRIRDVNEGPNGNLYLITDQPRGKLIIIKPRK